MIVGIGCDVVRHKITHALGWNANVRKLRRIFSSSELDLIRNNNSIKFISGRFAAKEAILKCLGTGMKDGISLTDIEILQNKAGQPVVHVVGGAKMVAKELGITHWHISISHNTTSSTAFVIAEK